MHQTTNKRIETFAHLHARDTSFVADTRYRLSKNKQNIKDSTSNTHARTQSYRTGETAHLLEYRRRHSSTRLMRLWTTINVACYEGEHTNRPLLPLSLSIKN
jgi:hypothetical protein